MSLLSMIQSGTGQFGNGGLSSGMPRLPIGNYVPQAIPGDPASGTGPSGGGAPPAQMAAPAAPPQSSSGGMTGVPGMGSGSGGLPAPDAASATGSATAAGAGQGGLMAQIMKLFGGGSSAGAGAAGSGGMDLATLASLFA